MVLKAKSQHRLPVPALPPLQRVAQAIRSLAVRVHERLTMKFYYSGRIDILFQFRVSSSDRLDIFKMMMLLSFESVWAWWSAAKSFLDHGDAPGPGYKPKGALLLGTLWRPVLPCWAMNPSTRHHSHVKLSFTYGGMTRTLGDEDIW